MYTCLTEDWFCTENVIILHNKVCNCYYPLCWFLKYYCIPWDIKCNVLLNNFALICSANKIRLWYQNDKFWSMVKLIVWKNGDFCHLILLKYKCNWYTVIFFIKWNVNILHKEKFHNCFWIISNLNVCPKKNNSVFTYTMTQYKIIQNICMSKTLLNKCIVYMILRNDFKFSWRSRKEL